MCCHSNWKNKNVKYEWDSNRRKQVDAIQTQTVTCTPKQR